MFQTNFSLKACKLPSDDLASKNAIFVSICAINTIVHIISLHSAMPNGG